MFAPPGKQAEVYNKMKDALAKIDDKAHPGLREQFEVAVERFEPGKGGSPGCEFISFPGFLSGPSECVFCVESGEGTLMMGCTDTPEPGKRYATILIAMNHGFSRGTVVSAFLQCPMNVTC